MFQGLCGSSTATTDMMAERCDVMVAHSPPLFTGHNSQPELSVIYQNFRLVMTTSQKPQSPLAARRCGYRSSDSPPREAKPRRPCLVSRSDSDGSLVSASLLASSSSSSSSSASAAESLSSGSSSDENDTVTLPRRKKKVVFADDRGLSLTQVRLMNEPSNQPPKLMTVGLYLNQLSTAGGCCPADGLGSGDQKQQKQARWKLRFSQPASSYLDFRKRLDMGNVSLENVIVKSTERRIVGTVKVRNLSYDKEVFIRCTHDKWATNRDVLCTYVLNNAMAMANGGCSSGTVPGTAGTGAGHQSNVTAIYDTFSFRVPLPVDAVAMEFAVCYKNDDFEFWDNNDGRNYCLSVDTELPSGDGHALLPYQSTASAPSSASEAPTFSLPSALQAEFDRNHHKQQPAATHYFGVQSKQNNNPWTTWRDRKSTSAYW